MSRDQEPETPNAPAPEVSAPKAPGPSAAEPETNSAMANFRKGVCTESQIELLLALGEERQDYQQLMATEDHKGVLLQRMEDSHLRRLWRLTNTLAKVRQGVLQKKDVKSNRANPECI